MLIFLFCTFIQLVIYIWTQSRIYIWTQSRETGPNLTQLVLTGQLILFFWGLVGPVLTLLEIICFNETSRNLCSVFLWIGMRISEKRDFSPPLHPLNFGAIESYVFLVYWEGLRFLSSIGGWPQRTRGSRCPCSARAQGSHETAPGLRRSTVYSGLFSIVTPMRAYKTVQASQVQYKLSTNEKPLEQ